VSLCKAVDRRTHVAVSHSFPLSLRNPFLPQLSSVLRILTELWRAQFMNICNPIQRFYAYITHSSREYEFIKLSHVNHAIPRRGTSDILPPLSLPLLPTHRNTLMPSARSCFPRIIFSTFHSFRARALASPQTIAYSSGNSLLTKYLSIYGGGKTKQSSTEIGAVLAKVRRAPIYFSTPNSAGPI